VVASGAQDLTYYTADLQFSPQGDRFTYNVNFSLSANPLGDLGLAIPSQPNSGVVAALKAATVGFQALSEDSKYLAFYTSGSPWYTLHVKNVSDLGNDWITSANSYAHSFQSGGRISYVSNIDPMMRGPYNGDIHMIVLDTKVDTEVVKNAKGPCFASQCSLGFLAAGADPQARLAYTIASGTASDGVYVYQP
jgi:hypothetical protein